MGARKLPLFLVGPADILPRFEKLSRHAPAVADRLALSGMDKLSPAELARRLAPSLARYGEALTREALDALDSARGRKRYAGGLAEVWSVVADMRAALVVIEETARASGRIGADRQLSLVDVAPDEPVPDGVSSDVVDSLIEAALDTDAEVRFVPDGTLAEDGRVAAVLRY